MSSKNITGVANTGSVFITGSLELNELKVPTIFNKRIEQNKIELYNEDVVLSSKSDYTINYNDGNLGTTPIFNIKKNGTEKFIINDSGADVKTGEIFYNGTALKNVTETLTNKSIDGNNNTITNVPSGSLPANVALTDAINTFTATQTFNDVITYNSNIKCDSIVGKTNNNTTLLFTNGVDVALETPDDIVLRYNKGGSGTTGTLKIRDNITNKVEVNTNGLDILDSGEVSYGGTLLRNITETLQNKTLTAPVIATIQPVVGVTITIPNATDTLVGKATTDTLTNKTLTNNVMASLTPSSGGGNTITFPDESDEVVLRTSSQILTNKTLNSAVMTSFRLATAGPNISIPVPSGNDNMVLRNHASTLTNKTITAADNTLTIASSNLTDGTNIPLKDGTNVFSGVSNTFNNPIIGNLTGDVTGNCSGDYLNGNFQGFTGRLDADITGITTTAITAVGGWLISSSGGASGARNSFQSGMSGVVSSVVPATFSLGPGIYLLNANVRIRDYGTTNTDILTLFWSTNGGVPGSRDDRYPQVVAGRRILQDEFSMTLNCTFRQTGTNDCALCVKAGTADSGGYDVDRTSWISITKLREA